MRKLYLSGADSVRIPAVMSGLEMATHMMNPELGNWWYTLSGLKKQHAANLHQIEAAAKPEWVGKTVTELHQQTDVLTLAVKRNAQFLTPPPATLTIESTDILITLIAK